MILLIVAATLGLGLVVAWRSATARRWLRYVVGAWLLLWAWLILGHYLPPIGYLGYTFPFVVAAFLFRHRLARRFPVLARLRRSRRPSLRETLIDEPTWWGDDE